MVILPLHHKLKKKIHKTIALAQDIIVMKMYDQFPNAIIHGGTAIWRCYGSNRFSEDIDVYLPIKDKNKEKLGKFLKILESQGMSVRKFKLTNGALFSKLLYEETEVRFEPVFKNIKQTAVKPFELTDGTFINVVTLSPEDLILEKILAYRKRKKVRDFYDVHFLLKFAMDRKKIEKDISEFIGTLEKPVDEKELRVLVISGALPTFQDLVKGVESWVR